MTVAKYTQGERGREGEEGGKEGGGRGRGRGREREKERFGDIKPTSQSWDAPLLIMEYPFIMFLDLIY